MSGGWHPAYCADRACHRQVEILANEQIARDTFRLRFACPEIARQIVPGQFVMLRLAGGDDPLLGRPLALYETVLDATGQPIGLEVVYLVLGRATRRLAKLGPGALLTVWGPLGNGFAPEPAEHLIMVAGGIGQTPFLALAREALGQRKYGDGGRDGQPVRSVPPVSRVTLCYGARTVDYLAGVDDFRQTGIDLRLCTDDGSVGRQGLVTAALVEVLDESPQAQVVCCGPERMMEAVATLCAARGVRCRVSLETPMACGIGICFSCVAKVRDAEGDGWDYRRTCVEGPVFDAQQIAW